MKLLPVDVSSFDKLIRRNFIYVDKTKYIYDLYSEGGNYHFLSRPRRFGKTLLISTLHELFAGNKKLFKGLWIEKSGWVWKKHPVIHLDFSTISCLTPQELRTNINDALRFIAATYKLDIPQKDTPESTLVVMVNKLAELYGNSSVVVLIDEYDYPILKYLSDFEKASAQREILKSFYVTLKGLDPYLRAIFITGVTKFSKTSIFSGINNLNDISIDPVASELLGYTSEEIKIFFPEYLKKLAQSEEVTEGTLLKKIKRWYNGYRFSPDSEARVYNPFSIGYLFKKKKFKNYWFESGTPTFLIELLKKQVHSLQNLATTELSEKSLGSFELDKIPLRTLLFQAGYLTIATLDKTTNKLMLDYPNEEVRVSFNDYLVAVLTEADPAEAELALLGMGKALKKNDIDAFCQILQSLFAHIPYTLHIEQEKYFHSLFQVIGTLLGVEVQSEVMTDKGRMDLVITTKTHTYIFEIKFKATPETALAQIKRNKYYERFIIKRKKIVLIGLSFSYLKKKLKVRWKIEAQEK